MGVGQNPSLPLPAFSDSGCSLAYSYIIPIFAFIFVWSYPLLSHLVFRKYMSISFGTALSGSLSKQLQSPWSREAPVGTPSQ